MFHQGIKGYFLSALFILLFLLVFSGCASAQVLGLPREQASQMLRKGDVSFIVNSDLPQEFSNAATKLAELNRIDPGAAFYSALLIEGSGQQVQDLRTLLFSAAMKSPSPVVRHEAAQRLIPLVLGSETTARNILGFLRNNDEITNTLRAACQYRLGRYEEALKLTPAESGGWARALALFSAWNVSGERNEELRQEMRDFLFSANRLEIRRWVYGQALVRGFYEQGLLKGAEFAVLSGNLRPGEYRAALNHYRMALADGGFAFFRRPALIAPLGRAYQFTAVMREEGAALFRFWNSLFDADAISQPPYSLSISNESIEELLAYISSLNSDERNEIRYMVLFFLGRIERARGHFAQSTEYFRQALEIAPNALQADACIWYKILNTMPQALSQSLSGAVDMVLDTMHKWDNMATFTEILDRVSSYLMRQRRWDTILEIFAALKSREIPGASLSQYAWIIGRATEEGYLVTNRSPKDFFRIALENERGSIYYRTLAAARLGTEFIPYSAAEETGNRQRQRQRAEPDYETDFLLGFFEWGAASFALPFLRERENELAAPSLRKSAQALANAGFLQDSMNFVLRYKRRQDIQITREDFYLSHPRPFLELIEEKAHEADIAPEVLFALIRTESFFRPAVVSRAGAVGLTQLMPATAADMAGRLARRGGPDYRTPDGLDLANPLLNVHIGSFYLRHLITQLENPMLALLAYNGGIGRTRRWLAADRQNTGGGLPYDLFRQTIEIQETRSYGRLLLSAAAIYGHLYYGRAMVDIAAVLYPFLFAD